MDWGHAGGWPVIVADGVGCLFMAGDCRCITRPPLAPYLAWVGALATRTGMGGSGSRCRGAL